MKLTDLVTEYTATRAPGWLVLTAPETAACLIEAARFYAAHGDIASISLSNLSGVFPGAPVPGSTDLPGPVEPAPEIAPSLPVKAIAYVTADTVVTMGEWSVIRPLFALYVERENAMRLEASRAAGIEVYGRMVSEIAQDISMMETETLPNKAFSHAVIEV